MKLVSLKQSRKKESALREAPEMPREMYPYGTKLHLENETVEKLPVLKSLKVGDSVMIQAEGKITAVRMSQQRDGKHNYNVDVQMQSMGIEKGGRVVSAARKAISSGKPLEVR